MAASCCLEVHLFLLGPQNTSDRQIETMAIYDMYKGVDNLCHVHAELYPYPIFDV